MSELQLQSLPGPLQTYVITLKGYRAVEVLFFFIFCVLLGRGRR